MLRIARAFLVVLFITPLYAAEYEKLLLPVTPSTVQCHLGSRYSTRLHLFNDSAGVVTPICFGADCGAVSPRQGATIGGERASVPLPSWMYVPRHEAETLSASILVQSSNEEESDHFFTELPVVPEREFRHRIELMGVRTDSGYRQTLRIYGRESDAGSTVIVRIYDLNTGELLLSPRHDLYIFPVEEGSELPSAPSFSMECDLTAVSRRLAGRQLRLVLEPLNHPEARIWAFVSVTSNQTQHFYTVVPR